MRFLQWRQLKLEVSYVYKLIDDLVEEKQFIELILQFQLFQLRRPFPLSLYDRWWLNIAYMIKLNTGSVLYVSTGMRKYFIISVSNWYHSCWTCNSPYRGCDFIIPLGVWVIKKKFDTFNKIKSAFPSVSATELKMSLHYTPKFPFVFPGCLSRTVVGLSLELLPLIWSALLPAILTSLTSLQPLCGVALVLRCEQNLASGFYLFITSLWPNTKQQKLLQTLPGLSQRKQRNFGLGELVLIQARASPSSTLVRRKEPPGVCVSVTVHRCLKDGKSSRGVICLWRPRSFINNLVLHPHAKGKLPWWQEEALSSKLPFQHQRADAAMPSWVHSAWCHSVKLSKPLSQINHC